MKFVLHHHYPGVEIAWRIGNWVYVRNKQSGNGRWKWDPEFKPYRTNKITREQAEQEFLQLTEEKCGHG